MEASMTIYGWNKKELMSEFFHAKLGSSPLETNLSEGDYKGDEHIKNTAVLKYHSKCDFFGKPVESTRRPAF